jgi:hypothetical protein
LALLYVLMAGVKAVVSAPGVGFDLFSDPLVSSFPAVLVGLGATLLAVWAVLWGTDRSEKFNLAMERERREQDRADALADARQRAVAQIRSRALFDLDEAAEGHRADLDFIRMRLIPDPTLIEDAREVAAISQIAPLALLSMESAQLREPEGRPSDEFWDARGRLRSLANRHDRRSPRSWLISHAFHFFDEPWHTFNSTLISALTCYGTTGDAAWPDALGIVITPESRGLAERQSRSYRSGLDVIPTLPTRLRTLVDLANLQAAPPYSAIPAARAVMHLEFTDEREYVARLEKFLRPPIALAAPASFEAGVEAANAGLVELEAFWAGYRRPSDLPGVAAEQSEGVAEQNP